MLVDTGYLEMLEHLYEELRRAHLLAALEVAEEVCGVREEEGL